MGGIVVEKRMVKRTPYSTTLGYIFCNHPACRSVCHHKAGKMVWSGDWDTIHWSDHLIQKVRGWWRVVRTENGHAIAVADGLDLEQAIRLVEQIIAERTLRFAEERPLSDDEKCDNCMLPIKEWPTIEVEIEVEIELTRARIF